MGRLIDAKVLFEKIADMEDLARSAVLHIPRNSPDYMRFMERLNLCSTFKHMVFDAPTAYDVEKIVKELEEYMDENKHETNSGFIEVCIDIVRNGGKK